jgi:hypothetical protein
MIEDKEHNELLSQIENLKSKLWSLKTEQNITSQRRGLPKEVVGREYRNYFDIEKDIKATEQEIKDIQIQYMNLPFCLGSIKLYLVYSPEGTLFQDDIESLILIQESSGYWKYKRIPDVIGLKLFQIVTNKDNIPIELHGSLQCSETYGELLKVYYKIERVELQPKILKIIPKSEPIKPASILDIQLTKPSLDKSKQLEPSTIDDLTYKGIKCSRCGFINMYNMLTQSGAICRNCAKPLNSNEDKEIDIREKKSEDKKKGKRS